MTWGPGENGKQKVSDELLIKMDDDSNDLIPVSLLPLDLDLDEPVEINLMGGETPSTTQATTSDPFSPEPVKSES